MAGIQYFIKCGQKKSLLVTLPRQNILVANSIPVNNLHHVYHTVMEVYNIKKKNASDQLQKKLNVHKGKYYERSSTNNELYVPENPRKKCTGFSYIGPKLYTLIPKNIKKQRQQMT